MNGYFYVLIAIDLFVLCFMCVLTHLSESLNKKQKCGFFLAFALIAIISGSDLVKVMTGIRRSGKSVMLELIKQ